MRKKKILALCAVVGVTASLVAGCGNDSKTTNTTKAASTEITAETVENVEESAEIEMEESATPSGASEIETDNITDVAETEEYTVESFNNFKSPVENEDGSVTIYGEITEDIGEGVYLVNTINGPFEITISEITEVVGDGTLEVGEYIEFVSDGVATMSLPGQMHTIFKVTEVTEADVMADTEIASSIAECIPAIERFEDESDVTYHAQIKALMGTEQMLVITNEGEKIINVNEELLNGEEYAAGELITFISDGAESRSIPAQIVGVKNLSHMETVLSKQTQAKIDRMLESLDNFDGGEFTGDSDVAVEETVEETVTENSTDGDGDASPEENVELETEEVPETESEA